MIGLARDAGWNPGESDGALFYGTDPEGFLVAVRGEDPPMGCLSAVRYGSQLGFIGLYLVEASHRGGAAGVVLARAAIRMMGNRKVGTDGVLERVEQWELDTSAGLYLRHHQFRTRLTMRFSLRYEAQRQS